MATTDPTECTVENLNAGEPFRGLNAASMAATNTVSWSAGNGSMTAPGSVSESTANETPGDPALDADTYTAPNRVHAAPGHLTPAGQLTWEAIRRGPR